MTRVDPIIAEIRHEVCRLSCTERCAAYAAGQIDYGDPKAACPRRGWMLAWGCLGPCQGPTPTVSRLPVQPACCGNKATLPVRKGLGDAVELVAKPVAVALDEVFRTRLAGCSACSRRRRWLNRAGWWLFDWLTTALRRSS